MGFFQVEFIFPTCDGDCGNSISDEVGDGTGFVEEAVDGQEKDQACDGDFVHGGERGGQGDESGAGDAGGTFGGEKADGKNDDLVAERERSVGGLGEEDGGHGHVDAAAVGVEGVSGGEHEADHGFAAAHAFELFDHSGEDGFGGGGGEGDEDFVFDVDEEFPEGDAAESGDDAEHDEDERDAGEIEAQARRARHGILVRRLQGREFR